MKSRRPVNSTVRRSRRARSGVLEVDMNDQEKKHNRRDDLLQYISLALYGLALLLLLVGPEWLTKNTVPRTILLILFCAPWVYYFGYSIYLGIEGLRNHPIPSLSFLVGNILLILALFGGEKAILISLSGLCLVCAGGLIFLIPKMKVIPNKLSKVYKGMANSYKEIKRLE